MHRDNMLRQIQLQAGGSRNDFFFFTDPGVVCVWKSVQVGLFAEIQLDGKGGA